MRRLPTMSRRQLLLASGAVAGVGALGSDWGSLAAAAELADRYFVFCYFDGGWDTQLSLDPKDPREFGPERFDQTRIQPGYDQLDVAGYPAPDVLETTVPTMRLGPFARPLVPWASMLTLVRGMSMDTLTHDVGRRRFLTGKPPAGTLARGSSLATHLTAQLGQGAAIPHLSARVESYNRDHPAWANALKVDDVDDLVRALALPAEGLPSAAQAEIDELLADFGRCPSTRRSPQRSQALDVRLSARDLVSRGIDARFRFDAPTPEMEAIRDHYAFDGNPRSPEAHAAMAAEALTSGISRCVSITPGRFLDTHFTSWATNQGPAQERGFAAVSALASDLRSRPYGTTSDSWLDRTVIIGFSEFGRTPWLNHDGGRDHWLTNACFLLGGGIPGGRVIGASSDVGMSPTPVDLQTGHPDAGGEIVRPEHIHRALLAHVGITDDVADLRAPALAAIL